MHIKVIINNLPESEWPVYELPDSEDEIQVERESKKSLLSDWFPETRVRIVETGEELLISDIYDKC